MKDIQILCIDNSEFAEYDAINRGFRGDIYIKILENFYNLNIYDIVRLQQDFELELEDYGVFVPEPNLVIIKEVNEVEITKLVKHLYEHNYFDMIKPLEKSKIQQMDLMHFGNVS